MTAETETPDRINERTMLLWYRTMRETLTTEQATRRMLQALREKLGRKLQALTFHTPAAKADTVAEVQALYERIRDETGMDATPTFLDHIQRTIPEAYAAYRARQ